MLDLQNSLSSSCFHLIQLPVLVRYDLITSNTVLEHVQDLELICKKMKNLLRVGGVMLHIWVNLIAADSDLDFVANQPRSHGGSITRSDIGTSIASCEFVVRHVGY